MSNIFITGMTAPQASPFANTRSRGFAGALAQTLTDFGHNVTWADPSVHYTRKALETSFDAVLVGVAPITGLGSNRAYGALKVIHELWSSPILTLFIDAPDPRKITAGLRAVYNNPENLVKPFYSYRKEYGTVVTNSGIQADIRNSVVCLLLDEWPRTIYPSLPWKNATFLDLLPDGLARVSGINVDAHNYRAPVLRDWERVERWSVDNFNTKWTRTVAGYLDFPTVPMKWNKGWTDKQVGEQIAHSTGVLISPTRDGTWWTPRITQALAAGTPIVTEWREAGNLGPAWNALAGTIETMDSSERRQLAFMQEVEYFARLKQDDELAEQLTDTLGLAKASERIKK